MSDIDDVTNRSGYGIPLLKFTFKLRQLQLSVSQEFSVACALVRAACAGYLKYIRLFAHSPCHICITVILSSKQELSLQPHTETLHRKMGPHSTCCTCDNALHNDAIVMVSNVMHGNQAVTLPAQ